MTNELQTVGAMHQCRAGEPYSTCVHCGALAEALNKPCPHFMRDAAQKLAAVASPTPQADSAPRPRQLLAQADPASGSLVGYFSDEKPPFAKRPTPQADSAQDEPLQAFDSPRAKALMRAWEEGWAACRDAEYVGEEAQNDAFNSSHTLTLCIAEDQQLPAPQADSQPAPVRDEREAFEAWFKREYHSRLCRNMPDKSYNDPMANSTWIGWQARAARAPADSVTTPAATPAAASIAWNALRDATDPLGETGTRIMGLVRVFAQRQYEAGLAEGRATQPAQAADSVLEDADPLQGAANWLAEAHGQFCVAVLQGCLMIGYNRAKRLHDAAIAARKQGGV